MLTPFDSQLNLFAISRRNMVNTKNDLVGFYRDILLMGKTSQVTSNIQSQCIVEFGYA